MRLMDWISVEIEPPGSWEGFTEMGLSPVLQEISTKSIVTNRLNHRKNWRNQDRIGTPHSF
jgi:hypothetical protein